jgi:acyl carrier protein
MDVEPIVKRIIAEQMGVPEEDVRLESDLTNDFNADSLDAVEIVMELEEEFDISISDEEAEALRSVEEIVEYLKERLKDRL